MKHYKIICSFTDHGIVDTHSVDGDFYDITDGNLDILVFDEESEQIAVATFCSGYWKAIYAIDGD